MEQSEPALGVANVGTKAAQLLYASHLLRNNPSGLGNMALGRGDLVR